MDILTKKEITHIQEAINDLQKLVIADNREDILIQIDLLNQIATNFIERHLNIGAKLHLEGRNIDEIDNNN